MTLVKDVLAKERKRAGILADKAGAAPPADLLAIRALNEDLRRAKLREGGLLEILREALDGWQARASRDDLARIEEMRKRLGLADAAVVDEDDE